MTGIAIGNCTTGSNNSIAIGNCATASNVNSIAIGNSITYCLLSDLNKKQFEELSFLLKELIKSHNQNVVCYDSCLYSDYGILSIAIKNRITLLIKISFIKNDILISVNRDTIDAHIRTPWVPLSEGYPAVRQNDWYWYEKISIHNPDCFDVTLNNFDKEYVKSYKL